MNMTTIGHTKAGYTVIAIPAGMDSPMSGHKGGEIAVDDSMMTMYTWEVFVITYGTDSIMKAAELYIKGVTE